MTSRFDPTDPDESPNEFYCELEGPNDDTFSNNLGDVADVITLRASRGWCLRRS